MTFLFASHATSACAVWLPETNKGYQLLERMGWDGKTGLGPEKEGRVEPVPTYFRKDRQGLGSRREVRRVTHFPAHSEREATQSKDGLSNAQRIYMEMVREGYCSSKRNWHAQMASVLSNRLVRRKCQCHQSTRCRERRGKSAWNEKRGRRNVFGVSCAAMIFHQNWLPCSMVAVLELALDLTYSFFQGMRTILSYSYLS